MRPAPPIRPLPIGAATRAATDDAQADAMRALADVLRPGVTLRIERTRPTWAAGFLEDYPIDAAGDALRSLLEHLRDEHGGQHYRITVLGAGDQALYSGSVPVAGPVRERGRPITREAWEAPRERPAAAQPQQHGGSEVAALLGVFGQMFQSMQTQADKASQATLEAVRDMARTSQRQTSDLTGAVLQIRADREERVGLSGQISELLDGVTAVDELRARVGSSTPKAAGDTPDEDEMAGAMKQAMGHFIGEFMSTMAQRKQRAAPPRMPPRTRIVRPRSVPPTSVAASVGSQPQGLPDAISGQVARNN